MKKYIRKIFYIGIIFSFLVNFYTNYSYADDTVVTAVVASAGSQIESTGSEVIGDFFDRAETQKDNETVTATKDIMGAIRSIIQVISISVALVMLVILAIKYMVSSVNDRAEIKKHAGIYVIGAIIIFAVNGIIGIIQNFSENISYQ